MKENNKTQDNASTKNDNLNKITDAGIKIADKVVDNLLNKGSKAAGSFVGKAAGTAATKALMPLILKIVLGTVLVGGIGWGVKKAFTPKPLSIDNTTNVIDKIRKIGEFTTLCYYEELVICEKRTDTIGRSFWSKDVKTIENEIVLIGKGRIRAGYNFKKINAQDIRTHGDTLDIVLPKVEIFDIIMNPSDFTTEYEEGTWSHETTTQLKVKAKQQLEINAQKYGLLEKAETNGIKRIKNLFNIFGFNTVNITIKER